MKTIWPFSKKTKTEERADAVITFDDALLTAIFSNTVISRAEALQIPTVQGCINKLAGTITRLPIKLYKRCDDNTIEEVKDDVRVRLLNGDTGDTLNSNEFWKSMLEDYYFGNYGALAYINKRKGEYDSIHYVESNCCAVVTNQDKIFKDYQIYIDGNSYLPSDFLKIKRKTKNGAENITLHSENSRLLGVAYSSLVFEKTMVDRGGNKRGFIESERTLDKETIKSIKTAWKSHYSNSTDNVVVLNNGVKFHESSNTAVEMQLNENKKSNSNEICKLFGFTHTILDGGATSEDKAEFISAVTDLITAIETALDRDMLRENEKSCYYFAFDVRELTRGNIKERFEAYSIGLDKNILQLDEVRELEDLKPLNFNYMKLGLADVLLDLKNKKIYTPNTNQTADLTFTDLTSEERANPNHDEKGRFTTANRYDSIKLSKKEYAKVISELNTNYESFKNVEKYSKCIGNNRYFFVNKGFDNYVIYKKQKIE